jgi:hypothetical protein
MRTRWLPVIVVVVFALLLFSGGPIAVADTQVHITL